MSQNLTSASGAQILTSARRHNDLTISRETEFNTTIVSPVGKISEKISPYLSASLV